MTEKEEKVKKTLDAVCEWFDTNPSRGVFEGDGGLANYVVGELPFIGSTSGVRDRMKAICRQIEKRYPSVSVPELESFTDGRNYLEKEEEFRRLRNEYKEHVLEK